MFVCFFLILSICTACSSEKVNTSITIEEPSVTLSAGDMLPLGDSARIENSGSYNLPDGAERLRWNCTGPVAIDIQSQSGTSSQQCLDSQQSVSAIGPGTITVRLGEGASFVILATTN